MSRESTAITYRHAEDRPSTRETSQRSSSEQDAIENVDMRRGQMGESDHEPAHQSRNTAQHEGCPATQKVRYGPSYEATNHSTNWTQSL